MAELRAVFEEYQRDGVLVTPLTCELFLGRLVLLFAASLAAGFGHGLYFPLGIVAAPLSIAGIKTASFATPLLWAVIGHGPYK